MRIIKTVSVVLLFFSQSMFCATIKFPSEKKLEKKLRSAGLGGVCNKMLVVEKLAQQSLNRAQITHIVESEYDNIIAFWLQQKDLQEHEIDRMYDLEKKRHLLYQVLLDKFPRMLAQIEKEKFPV